MLLRLVLYASLAWLSLGLSGVPTIVAKGCGIDPNGNCPSGVAAGGPETADVGCRIDPDGGGAMDPNGE